VTDSGHGPRIQERPVPGPVPLWTHPGWVDRFPWLVQGTTGRGAADEPFDLGLSGEQPVGPVLRRWRELLVVTEMPAAVHSRQVHGTDTWVHEARPAPGLLVMAGVDGHLTDVAECLLSVSVADCVPIFLVDAERHAVALLHAGWRGVADGMLEGAVARMRQRFGSQPGELWLHCGPAICGPCYPVGPEVHRAVRPEAAVPPAGTPLDLRSALLERAGRLELDPRRCSLSSHCTRCGSASAAALIDTAGASTGERTFFSHRGGDPARQMAVLGMRH
jgi:polyphenol oxidase